MFDNIGGKIKILAQIITWLETIAFVIFGIIVTTESAIGVVILIGGPIFSWVSSMILYGFGELIEKTCKIADAVSKEKEYVIETEDEVISCTKKESPMLHSCELCEKKTNTLFTISLHGEDTDVCQECFETYVNADQENE